MGLNVHVVFVFFQVMREVGWVIFDEIHYMHDPGELFAKHCGLLICSVTE